MTPDEIETATQTALADVFSTGDTMISRFILVAEVLTGDGDRALWQCTSDGLKDWDAHGLLGYALASLDVGYLADEDDE